MLALRELSLAVATGFSSLVSSARAAGRTEQAAITKATGSRGPRDMIDLPGGTPAQVKRSRLLWHPADTSIPPTRRPLRGRYTTADRTRHDGGVLVGPDG